jgi:hypothetical protein
MPSKTKQAAAEFRRTMKWIVAIAITMVVAALGYEASQDMLSVHMAVATIFGVFFAMTLGAGLFALAFFSDKSGHDDLVTNATKLRRNHDANSSGGCGQPIRSDPASP